jgi:exodeoxyribonuclease VII small subunit
MEDNSQMTYTQAVSELEQLVQKMQDPQCSIDNLTAYTKRSKELLDFCRKKLTQADEQLKQILATIQQQG